MLRLGKCVGRRLREISSALPHTDPPRRKQAADAADGLGAVLGGDGDGDGDDLEAYDPNTEVATG
jgi:hypothetical protein